MDQKLKKFENVSWKDSIVTGGFWQQKQKVNVEKTIPSLFRFFKQTGRMDCMKALYRPDPDGKDVLQDRANGKELGYLLPSGEIVALSLADLQGERFERDLTKPPRPHVYWDSDAAKWIEGAAYALRTKPDPEVERIIDEIVDEYELLQMEDGYVNSYFTVLETDKRFERIWNRYELYCAGHMMEAAVAYYEATGKRKYLDILIRYADLICKVFGPEEGQIHAYPGHQEIEIGLVKLYRVTGDEKYLNLSKYFIDERGKQPYYYDIECEKNGINPNTPFAKGYDVRDGYLAGPYAQNQSHLPVREQKEAVGHAVRVAYMGASMADLSAETGDESLLSATNTLWDDITQTKMSVTGGIGAEVHGERFAFSYQLPNEEAYNETCASIGMAMWGARMLQMEADSRYADIVETEVYNGTISGVSLDGESFFYANHLQCEPNVYYDRVQRQSRMFPVRQKDFPVSCCPPNIARMIASITGYAFTQSADSVYVHLYLDCETRLQVGGKAVVLKEKTEYPRDGRIVFTIGSEEAAEFTLGLRIPGWCECWNLSINGEPVSCRPEKGYVKLSRLWQPGDEVTLDLEMKPFLVEANPQVRMNCGKVAIQCGPFVYCLEEADNEGNLFDLTLSEDAGLELHYDPDLLGGTTCITGKAHRRSMNGWQNTLYKKLSPEYETCAIKAIPYYLWSNRRLGRMEVWIEYR